MRKHGSVRFAPYYKAQWWEERSQAWRDIQKACPTPEAARTLFGEGLWRVMEITEQGRRPLPD